MVSLLAAKVVFGADQNECPWMNAATAAGIIGRPVGTKAVGTNACVFKAARSAYVLRVDVKAARSSPESCGSHPQALRGIGNEAIACEHRERKGHRMERVVGRVRNQVFVITVTTTDRSAAQVSLLAKAESAAEQVAGSLF